MILPEYQGKGSNNKEPDSRTLNNKKSGLLKKKSEISRYLLQLFSDGD